MRWTLAAVIAALTACGSKPDAAPAPGTDLPPSAAGLAGVKDNQSQKDVVKIAASSPDHTTLVAAVTAAKLGDVLASSGPYTVFAPTNAAFDKLPKGTVEDLLKPANSARLQAVLRHHVTTSVYELADLTDGQTLGMADGTSATIAKRGPDTYIGDAKILGSVRGSNGIVHVVDAVVLAK